MATTTQVNVKEVEAKFRSKHEMYKFLTEECGIYMPEKHSVNVYFIKEILGGKKKVSFRLMIYI